MSTWMINDDAPIDWHSKAFGPAQQGRTPRELVGTALASLPTPVLTLDAGAVENNIAVMSAYTAEHGVQLAPHGKTTMSPALWQLQLDAGAWAITVATPWQLRVAAASGVPRILHAGAIVDAAELANVGQLMRAGTEILVWADSPAVVALTAAGYPADAPPLPVLVDRGGPGARTGARTVDAALETAQAVAAAPNLILAGVCAWEGSITGMDGPDGRQILESFCDGAAEAFEAIAEADLFAPGLRPILTGGGSSYFDIVVQRWSHLRDRAQLILRSGCYLTHDDGTYARTSPLAAPLRAALHAWAQVVSRPEPGLALLNAGRRDVPYDSVLPVPQAIRGRSAASSAAALQGATVTALNDQHTFLAVDPSSDLAVGDVVRFGISHPCMAFDKWSAIPVVDDAQAAAPTLTGVVRTVF